MFQGGIRENIAHYSSSSGADDRCGFIAGNSSSGSRLGLARRMGLGRTGTGVCGRSVSRWRLRSAITYGYGYPVYGYGYGYPGYRYGYGYPGYGYGYPAFRGLYGYYR